MTDDERGNLTGLMERHALGTLEVVARCMDKHALGQRAVHHRAAWTDAAAQIHRIWLELSNLPPIGSIISIPQPPVPMVRLSVVERL